MKQVGVSSGGGREGLQHGLHVVAGEVGHQAASASSSWRDPARRKSCLVAEVGEQVLAPGRAALEAAPQ